MCASDPLFKPLSGPLSGKESFLIGVMSDTHGWIPESAFNAFHNVDLIIHAGDIDTPEALNTIKTIGPHVIVRGNMDYGTWAQDLRETETIQVGEVTLYIRHILTNLNAIPASANVNAIIFGHTHRPFAEQKDDILYLNPGSAGQKRHNYPLSVALLSIQGKSIKATHIQL